MDEALRFCPWCMKRIKTPRCACGASACTTDDILLDERLPFSGLILGDRYRVTRFIDKGGMGAVYKGFDSVTDRMVAIKFLTFGGDEEGDQTLYRRFKQEARCLARLRNPHTVTFLDFEGMTRGTPYLVMELLRGRTLANRLWQEGPLAPLEAVLRLAPVCDALDEAHSQGILHRDIKPSNIFLHRPGAEATEVVKVLDFGIARILGSNSSKHLHLFRSRLLIGTPEYMPPEQIADGQEPSLQSDLYALGIVLFEVLTGTIPFSGTSEEVLRGHLERPPPSLDNVEMPADLRQLLADLLQKDPARRPRSAGEVRKRLVDTLGSVRNRPSAT